MSRRLILLRHGQTAWNLEGRGQGHTDVELDAIGHDQAAEVASAIAAYRPSLLWCSDLARAHQTASYVAKECELEPVPDTRLREFDLGRRTGLTLAEYADQFPVAHADHVAGQVNAAPGGETADEVAVRIRAGMDDFLAALEPAGTGVVVSHGGALKIAVVSLLGWPTGQAADLQRLDNCGRVVLDEVDETGRFRLTAYNLVASNIPGSEVRHQRDDPDFPSGDRVR